jgi:hypothetical protein
MTAIGVQPGREEAPYPAFREATSLQILNPKGYRFTFSIVAFQALFLFLFFRGFAVDVEGTVTHICRGRMMS